MKNTHLRTAVILGTAALIWSIPSLNIFGIIAAIMSWVAYSNNKSSTAKTAMVMYIVAVAASAAFAALMLVAQGAVMAFGDAAGGVVLFGGMAAFSVIGDILYIAAAVVSCKGARLITDQDSQSNGFFD